MRAARARWAGRAAVGSLLAAGLAVGPTAGTTPSVAATVTPYSVYVAVNVATLWASTTAPRSIDAPALTAPANIRQWLAQMDTTARRGLVGRVETQALFGERLLVIGTGANGWLHVVAVGQATSRDSRGYPGWVPGRQTTRHAPVVTEYVATVVKPTGWLVDNSGAKVLEVSFATRLPIRSVDSSWATVYTPAAGTRRIARSAVVVRTVKASALPRTVSGVVSTARSLLGIPYLWGGRSGFALDCSGLTQLVYRLHAVTLPRDTTDQVKAGRAVALGGRAAGDLLFYGSATAPTHVALMVTASTMVEAPSSGLNVREVSIRAPSAVRRLI